MADFPVFEIGFVFDIPMDDVFDAQNQVAEDGEYESPCCKIEGVSVYERGYFG